MSQLFLEPAAYKQSVVAVPPIALNREGKIAREANCRIMRHIADGGIKTVLYGGNANLYHFGAEAYREAIVRLFADCPPELTLLFGIGPDFGKAMDQTADILKAEVQNVLLLPMAFPSDPSGVEKGIRLLADRFRFPLVVYIKRDRYLEPRAVESLVSDGCVSFVKYAVEREDPENDAYLDELVAAIGENRIASGMGETPIANHIGKRQLSTFTSGAVCIAPAASNELLHVLRSDNEKGVDELIQPFLEFERIRAELGGTAVLHDGITLSGIADCGPLTPLVSNLDRAGLEAIRPAIAGLLAAEQQARTRAERV